MDAAGAFCLGTAFVKGKEAAAEFFTAYIVEQSLSVDNLFIFIMLFDYFKVPSELQVRWACHGCCKNDEGITS